MFKNIYLQDTNYIAKNDATNEDSLIFKLVCVIKLLMKRILKKSKVERLAGRQTLVSRQWYLSSFYESSGLPQLN